jgi:hypothetical protein
VTSRSASSAAFHRAEIVEADALVAVYSKCHELTGFGGHQNLGISGREEAYPAFYGCPVVAENSVLPVPRLKACSHDAIAIIGARTIRTGASAAAAASFPAKKAINVQ